MHRGSMSCPGILVAFLCLQGPCSLPSPQWLECLYFCYMLRLFAGLRMQIRRDTHGSKVVSTPQRGSHANVGYFRSVLNWGLCAVSESGSKKEQVTSSLRLHMAFIWPAVPSARGLWAHRLAEPGYGFRSTCKCPEGYATCQKTRFKYPLR